MVQHLATIFYNSFSVYNLLFCHNSLVNDLVGSSYICEYFTTIKFKATYILLFNEKAGKFELCIVTMFYGGIMDRICFYVV